MIVCLAAAVVNVIGNYLSIPYFGANAAAGTTAVCNLTILILLLFRVDKRIKIGGTVKVIVSPVVGCIAIFIVCYLCKRIDHLFVRFFVSVLGSIVVYGLIQIICKNELVAEIMNTIKIRVGR